MCTDDHEPIVMNSLARQVVEARFFSLSHFFPRFRTVQPTSFRPKTVENDLDISWREREGNWVAGEEVSSSSIH